MLTRCIRARARRTVPQRIRRGRTSRRPLGCDPMSEIIPPLFRDLRELAGNYWWSWQLDGPEVFRDISRSLWETCGHNPRKLLDETLATRLTELDIDPHYRTRALDLLERFRAAMVPPAEPVAGLDPGTTPERPIAYFSAEF